MAFGGRGIVDFTGRTIGFCGFLVPFQVYQQAALPQKAKHIKRTLCVLPLGDGHIHTSLIYQTFTSVSEFGFFFVSN